MTTDEALRLAKVTKNKQQPVNPQLCVEIFRSDDYQGLEHAINTWLSDNVHDPANVRFVNQTSSVDRLTIAIWYCKEA